VKLRRERGIALIAMLWAVLLLSAIASSFLMSTRTELRISRNFIGQASARALADAGVHRALQVLLEPVAARRWKADRRVYAFALGSGEVAVALEDEGGKIDLNMAPPELLEGLLRSVGLSREEAGSLVQSILDRRNTPRDRARRPFHSTEELRTIPGLAPNVFEKLVPAVTIYSRQPGLDPTTASPQALAAIPGLSADDIEATLEARAEPAGQLMARVPALARTARFLSRSAGLAYTVIAQGRSHDGSVFVRRAVVVLSHDPDRPYRIYTWLQHTAPLIK
jgi:general secretion pathway protein K